MPATARNNFANFKQFTISGIKYTDVNGLDANTSIGGDDTAGTPCQTFTINLYDWKYTALNPGVVDASLLPYTTLFRSSATTGAWSFGSLGPLGAGEKYYVKEIGETGWTQTFGTAGDIITPTSGTDSTTNNFANFKQFTISGIKYTDVNGLDGNNSIIGNDPAGTT